VAVRLRDIAPRLAKARDGLLDDRRRERAGREHIARLKLRAERNLAHRELQLVRASSTRDGRYIAERQRKLRAAQEQMAKLNDLAAGCARP